MADTTPKSYSADPTLYLYTSLTAGSSHIITATSRLETILKANKIPFRALDVATDEKARMLWGRRSKGKKLPGLVKFGSIVGDLEEVEEWNEYGELKQQIGSTPVAASTPTTSATSTPSRPPPLSGTVPGATSTASPDKFGQSPFSKEMSEEVEQSSTNGSKKEETPLTMAMRQAGAEAAKKAGEKKGCKSTALASMGSSEDTELPINPPETKMAKAMEEPGTSADSTASKVPEKLAEEGAKRTSIDRIADKDAKRSNIDTTSQLDGANEQEHVGISKEATKLEVKRASSVTKMKSPLSEEIAATSDSNLETVNSEPQPKTHQGSSISVASKEKIQEIEKRNAILEEVDTDKSSHETGAPSTTAPARSLSNRAGEVGDSNSARTTNVEATNEGEIAATKGIKSQEQDPKDALGANTSVGD